MILVYLCHCHGRFELGWRLAAAVHIGVQQDKENESLRSADLDLDDDMHSLVTLRSKDIGGKYNSGNSPLHDAWMTGPSSIVTPCHVLQALLSKSAMFQCPCRLGNTEAPQQPTAFRDPAKASI